MRRPPWLWQPRRQAPPPPDAAVVKALGQQVDKLERKIATLQRLGVADPYLAEVEIYHKAAIWVLEHKEFNQKGIADWTREILDRGLLRAAQQERGETPWLLSDRPDVSRAYRSRIDGSVQPYAVTFPADYGKDKLRKWRVDVVLHGRNDYANRGRFLHQHDGVHNIPDRPGLGADRHLRPRQQRLSLGRRNRRAGGRRELPRRRTAAGPRPPCSTATASCCAASRWAAPGRGTSVCIGRRVVRHRPRRRLHHHARLRRNVPDKLPPYQEACLSIYDAVDYAENAFDVPVVAYDGGRRPAVAGGAQHRGEAQAAGHSHDAAGRAGTEAPVPGRVAEKGGDGIREVHRQRPAGAADHTSISSPTLSNIRLATGWKSSASITITSAPWWTPSGATRD